jgi:hypothetical protein
VVKLASELAQNKITYSSLSIPPAVPTPDDFIDW